MNSITKLDRHGYSVTDICTLTGKTRSEVQRAIGGTKMHASQAKTARQMHTKGCSIAEIQATTGLCRMDVQRAISARPRARQYRTRDTIEELLAEGHDRRIVEACFGNLNAQGN